MKVYVFELLLFLLVVLSKPSVSEKVYSIWHCGDDCAWTSQPSLTSSNWIVNRGDGTPTCDYVIFSFMDPIALLNKQNTGGYTNGVPKGMISSISFFASKGVKVIFSIGGASWTGRFSQALSSNATQFGKNAADVSKQYGVGIEIDYEDDSNTHLNQLQAFVTAYRNSVPYDPAGNVSSLLTIDCGSGTDYLGGIAGLARGWINSNKINWLNAMVDEKPWTDINKATAEWQQHLNAGLAPSKLIVSQYGDNTCASYTNTILESTVKWAQSKNIGGISFWAAGTSNDGELVTNCPGIEQGSKAYLG